MKKRNLATALAVLAIAGAVVPMTANAATAEPFNVIAYEDVTPEVWADMFSADRYTWYKNADISRKENESEYDYYNRLRDYTATYWTLTTEVPKTAAQAAEYAKAHKADNAGFYGALANLIDEKSDLMYLLTYFTHFKNVDGNYSAGGHGPTRYTEMTNEYGQKQIIPSVLVHNCTEGHNWWEKDLFGVIRLDDKLYAMKMTTDSATCGTLIPYEELGYKNCDLHWEWNTNMLTARGYQGTLVKSNDKYVDVDIYDSDGSYDYITAYKTEKQWVVDGVLLYYCENGKITPMTKALHDTLPKNNTHHYDIASGSVYTIPNGWKLFAD